MKAKNLDKLHREVAAYLAFYTVVYPDTMMAEYIHYDKINGVVERIRRYTNAPAH